MKTYTLTQHKPKPAEPTYTITLDLTTDQVDQLHALIGSVRVRGSAGQATIRQTLGPLWDELETYLNPHPNLPRTRGNWTASSVQLEKNIG